MAQNLLLYCNDRPSRGLELVTPLAGAAAGSLPGLGFPFGLKLRFFRGLENCSFGPGAGSMHSFLTPLCEKAQNQSILSCCYCYNYTISTITIAATTTTTTSTTSTTTTSQPPRLPTTWRLNPSSSSSSTKMTAAEDAGAQAPYL